MVQINLLPPSSKKKQKGKIELEVKLEPLIFILAGTILAIGIVWLLLNVKFSAQKKELAHLDQRLESLKFSSQKLESLESEKALLVNNLDFIQQQLKQDILWSRNLNRISDLVPEGIWFKRISFNADRDDATKYINLDISGSAVSYQDEQMIDSIGKFMTALKNDPVFTQQFSEIKLLSSKRSKFGKIEIMDFDLSCMFK